jgi:hypothetical protein
VFNVTIKKKAARSVAGMPELEQKKFRLLVIALRANGPVQLQWQNYSRLGGAKHHCHLSRRWVACWEETEKGLTIEVYYAGSRESAPY